MTSKYRTRAVKAIRVYCPVDEITYRNIALGDVSAFDQNATLSKMLSIIRGDNPLGDFGIYKSVVELSLGWELFTPSAAANPILGEAGSNTASPTVVLTVYIAEDASDLAIERALNAIIEAHPWEIPVIEFAETQLLIRG